MDPLTNNLNLNNIFFLLTKIFVIVGGLIYLIFALLIVKQVKVFSKNIRDKFNRPIMIASYLHLILAFLLIFLALLFL
ncbi:MAG TPA: hypothetical protein PK131_00670 [Candidatus Woesebacteria bacterium]|nr:hypothetical protein [Candidatus Woesebacteria bacterium]HRS22706.1 hypothetical protein [Candidatus Woesebacteria bacterium]HRT40012.1 hypothetical protein [Candidatus Woesebacteria bacterium]